MYCGLDDFTCQNQPNSCLHADSSWSCEWQKNSKNDSFDLLYGDHCKYPEVNIMFKTCFDIDYQVDSINSWPGIQFYEYTACHIFAVIFVF